MRRCIDATCGASASDALHSQLQIVRCHPLKMRFWTTGSKLCCPASARRGRACQQGVSGSNCPEYFRLVCIPAPRERLCRQHPVHAVAQVVLDRVWDLWVDADHEYALEGLLLWGERVERAVTRIAARRGGVQRAQPTVWGSLHERGRETRSVLGSKRPEVC